MKPLGAVGVAACAAFALSGCGRMRVPLPDVGGILPRPPSARTEKGPLPILNEEAFAKKPLRAYRIPTPKPGEIPPQTVIGEVTSHRIRTGETLLDVARYYDLGMNEIIDANPRVDIWSPKVGTTVVVPTQWILPCCTYEGMVVNVAEMRLFYYEKEEGDPATTVVRTYPLGLGRDDRRTPKGSFRVTGKTVNPTWVIPERIRQDHIRENGDARRSIAGGAADNPLGKYRFELSLEPYRIHGTNIPWGIGMLVSNGCARLYPEDVEHLFPMVSVGTKGAFIYQPVKVGTRSGNVYVEAHADLYKQNTGMPPNASKTLRLAGMGPGDASVEAVVREAQGVPKKVGGATQISSASSL
jgi:L,D-transpeptidase ErfK/SrfK